MAISELEAKYLPKDNSFYISYYMRFFYGLMGALGALFLMTGIVFFQIYKRPLPPYYAVQPDRQKLPLNPSTEPSLIAPTILRFASKAATIAYTFNFVNYQEQLQKARPYFTDNGWKEFNNSISGLLSTIVERQLFVSGVVSGAPVISNEGPLPGIEYAWRVQIPFLSTYSGSNATSTRNNYVLLTIVRVPTSVNPQGIGIDQFVMR